jgi:hypothetical protein
MADPDVLEALAVGGYLGTDGADAPSFVIEVEGHTLGLYMNRCRGEPVCNDIPAAVGNLRRTLEAFAREEVLACTDDEGDGGTH